MFVKVFLFVLLTGGCEERLKSAERCTVSSTGISGVRLVAGKRPARDFWTEVGAELSSIQCRNCGGKKRRWISYTVVEGNPMNKVV